MTLDLLLGEVQRLFAARRELAAARQDLRKIQGTLTARHAELRVEHDDLFECQQSLRFANGHLHAGAKDSGPGADDLLKLLSLVRHPVIIVDRSLRIRKISRSAECSLGVTEGDLGRPLECLGAPFDAAEVLRLLDDVVTSARTLEIDVDAGQVDEGRLRASPYQAGGVVEGAIVEVFGRPDRLRTP